MNSIKFVELQPPKEPHMQPFILHIQDPPNAQIVFKLVQSLNCSPIADSVVSASTSSIHCILHSQSATMKNLMHIYMCVQVLETCF